MDQATQATTPTASTESRDLADPRAAYKRVAGIAQRIIDRLTTVMPNAVEVYREAGAYGIRLHFGLGLTAGRGVLEVARIADVEATRDATFAGSEAWIECRANVEGVHLVARALLTKTDADQLMQRTPAPAPAEDDTPPAVDQPVPLGASVLAQVPAVTPAEAIGGGQ
ncbi:hypothetical protein ACFUIY_14590 [Streptomyces griseorubiginosus]|uniref:hypothetical protein n=1 Tax=Streptomyces griseorubiginosus TaxID=67304 RepID=UPI00362A0302